LLFHWLIQGQQIAWERLKFPFLETQFAMQTNQEMRESPPFKFHLHRSSKFRFSVWCKIWGVLVFPFCVSPPRRGWNVGARKLKMLLSARPHCARVFARCIISSKYNTQRLLYPHTNISQSREMRSFFGAVCVVALQSRRTCIKYNTGGTLWFINKWRSFANNSCTEDLLLSIARCWRRAEA